MASTLPTVLLLSSHVCGTPWGSLNDGSRFPAYIDDHLSSTVVAPTTVQAAGPRCQRERPFKCPVETVQVLEEIVRSNGRAEIYSVLDSLHVQGHQERHCVHAKVSSILHFVYISPAMLNWLLVINQAGVNLMNDDFVKLFNRKSLHRPGTTLVRSVTEMGKLVKREIRNFNPHRPAFDHFSSDRCELQFWYTRILSRYAGSTVAQMGLTVVPKLNVIAPAAEIVTEVLNHYIGVFSKIGGGRGLKRRRDDDTEEEETVTEFLNQDEYFNSRDEFSIMSVSGLDGAPPKSPSTLTILMELIDSDDRN